VVVGELAHSGAEAVLNEASKTVSGSLAVVAAASCRLGAVALLEIPRRMVSGRLSLRHS
jgi:hypothetical protein